LEPYANVRPLRLQTFSTFFSDGVGEGFFVHGLVSESISIYIRTSSSVSYDKNIKSIARQRWYHLGLQSYLPNSASKYPWCVKHDDAYFGGSCIKIQAESKHPFQLSIAY
jgi:hypothetical protein